MSMLMTRHDLSDDSWVDHMEQTQDPFGSRAVETVKDLVHSTGEWPTELLRAVKYQGRKRSDALDRSVLFLRLSKLIQFTYLSVLVFCGATPTVVAALNHEPKYLVLAFFILLVPPLWMLENLVFRCSHLGKHHTFTNNDTKVRFYNTRRVAHQAELRSEQ